MTTDNLWEVLSNRRSVREYSPKAVSKDFILKAVEYAVLAPSAHNSQPWRFIQIKEGKRRDDLVSAMADRFLTDMSMDGVPDKERIFRAQESVRHFSQAPVLLLACISLAEMHSYPDDFRKKNEEIMAIQSLSAAMENLLLALEGMGISSGWYCAPLFCPDVVKTFLGLPVDFQPQAFITAGYCTARMPKPRRKSLSEIFLEI